MNTKLGVLCSLFLIRLILIAPSAQAQNTVQTIAGGGPNNLPALKSSLGTPASIVLDGAGNVYLSDLYSERVLKVAVTGNVTVVAGDGARGGLATGDGGPAVSARFDYPSGVALDSAGNIFIADKTLCTIREVSVRTGNISTVVGSNGNCFYSGDGGPATSAELNNPSGVAVDGSGNIFIADSNNCLIRGVSAATGIISTLAGIPPDITGLLHCGTAGNGGLAINAKVGFVNGLALDGSGNLFIADPSFCVVREISASTGIISSVAGTGGNCAYSGDGGPGTSALLNQPYGVAVVSSGNVFIADTTNCLIRKVSASNLNISTVAGDYSMGCGYSGDGAAATSALLNQPYAVAVDSSGDILIADYSNSVIRKVSGSTGNISTFAGVAVPDPAHPGEMIGLGQYSGDGHVATDAQLGFFNGSPYAAGIAIDPSGNVLIADTVNQAVRKVSASTGIITTVAGNGVPGYSGDGGPATSSQLSFPRDVAVDHSGNIIIMDDGNCVVREISAATGLISTVAGTPPDSAGNYYCGFSGDGGPATRAQLYPIDFMIPAGGVAVDDAGNIFVADTGNGAIREVSAATGIISTVAGTGGLAYVGFGGDGGPATSALLNTPYGVAVDASDNIFIADTLNTVIREVVAANGNIYTVAGEAYPGVDFSGDGGAPDAANFGYVFGMFLDPAGNLFIPDPGNCVISMVSGSTGIISTVAGTGNSVGGYFCGYSGDGGPALEAVFDDPGTAAADRSGNVFVWDDIRVRSVAGLAQGPAAAAVPFPNPLVFPIQQPVNITSNPLAVMLSNRGSVATNVSTLVISGPNGSDFSETDNCAGSSLSAGGGTCTINLKFTPSKPKTETGLLTITDTAGTQTVDLTGTGVTGTPEFSPSPTTISFGNQQEGVTSAPEGVEVFNNGNLGLTIGAVTISGPNAGDFAITSNLCSGTTVPPNVTACGVSVAFTPSTTGAETGSLEFADDAAGTPQSVGLTGTGTGFSMALAPGASASATVTPGNAATYSLQVTSISGFSGTVALSCAGAPAESTCTPSVASITPNGNTAVQFSVKVTTTAPSIVPPGVGRQRHPFDGLHVLPIALMVALSVMLLVFASRFRGTAAQPRRAYALAVPLALLLLTIMLSSCGGGGSSSIGPPPPPPSGGTPTGTYTLTITGSSNGVSYSQTLTLIVN